MENEEILQLQQQIDALRSELQKLNLFKDDILYNNGLANNDLKLDPGRKFISGSALFTSGEDSTQATSAVMSTGRDKSAIGGVDNSQATLVRIVDSISVFYGLGGKVISGKDAKFVAGSNTITSEKFNFIPQGELENQFITVQLDDSSLLNLRISTNSGDTITTQSSLIASSIGTFFVVYQPVFLGGEEYPWQKLFVHGGELGGVQFGGGTNGNGANGLLFAEGQNLIYKKPNGTEITIA